jgi:hypothetical protein
MRSLIIILLLLAGKYISAQEVHHEGAYTLHKNQWILYSDIGYRTSPFTLKYNFSPEIDKLKFRHNINPILGFGVHYKWFALRIGIGLPSNVYSVNKYGRHTPVNVGAQFSIKKMFIDVDFRYNNGYVIKNANRWDTSLTQLHPNKILSGLNSLSLTTNFWHFRNKEIHMKPILGRAGHYNRDAGSFYLKYTFNIYGVSNNDDPGAKELIPINFIKSAVAATQSRGLAAVDIGVVPGYAFVKRLKNWQFSILGGLGGVLQTKFYSTSSADSPKNLIGIAPRIDLKFVGGYNDESYFCHLDTDFDIKTARYQRLSYRQYFYSIKLVGGIRLKEKQKKSKRKKS